MRFGVAAMYQSVHDQVRFARVAEEHGFDLLGYGDSQNLLPEMLVALTAMVQVTERIAVAPTVTNPVTRHPAVVANAFSTLQELSGGRVRLGIGTGDSAVRNIGERAATVAEIEDYCRCFKALVAGRDATYRGKSMRFEFDPEPVPLWMAAEGPRMLHLAGQIADGVMLGNGIARDVVADTRARIQAGAESVGRSLDDIELWWMPKLYPAVSEAEATEATAYSLAASANHAFRFGMEGKFLPEELRPAMQRLLDEYRSEDHNLQARGAHNASLVIDGGLGEFLADRYLVGGPPDRIVARIDEIRSWGVDNLFIPGVFGDPVDYVAEVAEIVRPAGAPV